MERKLKPSEAKKLRAKAYKKCGCALCHSALHGSKTYKEHEIAMKANFQLCENFYPGTK